MDSVISPSAERSNDQLFTAARRSTRSTGFGRASDSNSRSITDMLCLSPTCGAILADDCSTCVANQSVVAAWRRNRIRAPSATARVLDSTRGWTPDRIFNGITRLPAAGRPWRAGELFLKLGNADGEPVVFLAGFRRHFLGRLEFLAGDNVHIAQEFLGLRLKQRLDFLAHAPGHARRIVHQPCDLVEKAIGGLDHGHLRVIRD